MRLFLFTLFFCCTGGFASAVPRTSAAPQISAAPRHKKSPHYWPVGVLGTLQTLPFSLDLTGTVPDTQDPTLSFTLPTPTPTSYSKNFLLKACMILESSGSKYQRARTAICPVYVVWTQLTSNQSRESLVLERLAIQSTAAFRRRTFYCPLTSATTHPIVPMMSSGRQTSRQNIDGLPQEPVLQCKKLKMLSMTILSYEATPQQGCDPP